MNNTNLFALPDDLPVPQDDGACNHLIGREIPSITLSRSGGETVNVRDAAQKLTVFFFYPETGKPGMELDQEWDLIPGARGCTPELCEVRDLAEEFRMLDVQVFGVSIQPTQDHNEFIARTRFPFSLLSDQNLTLASALKLPTFIYREKAFIKRVTLVAHRGRIIKVFYPVFPPDKHPKEVLRWIQTNNPAR